MAYEMIFVIVYYVRNKEIMYFIIMNITAKFFISKTCQQLGELIYGL